MAVKVLHENPATDPARSRRFEAEVRAVAALTAGGSRRRATRHFASGRLSPSGQVIGGFRHGRAGHGAAESITTYLEPMARSRH